MKLVLSRLQGMQKKRDYTKASIVESNSVNIGAVLASASSNVPANVGQKQTVQQT
jgi:hypothetical protein